VSMPVSSLPTSRTEDHAIGNLVLHLTIDGQGQVTRAAIAQSSGDSVLDANALAIAQRWRFAVPADHPQGLSGDLPLRFAGDSAQVRM
jgi:periplasmic protein TonB